MTTETDARRATGEKQSSTDETSADLQARADERNEKGFIGAEVDQTPNENYTVAGVTEGLPTPETDKNAAKEAGSRKFDHAKG